MEWLFLLIILAVVALILMQTLLRTNLSSSEHSYKLRDKFLSPAERSFYGVLEQAVSDRLKIHAKVRVADVIQPNSPGDRSSWQKAFNKISAKHFDYVLCDPATLEVKAALEDAEKAL